jgi:hypothetical protein
MALPIQANTTCDIYRTTRAPPLGPDIAGVPCYLKACYNEGLEHGESDNPAFRYTHVMLVDVSTDVRDSYNSGSQGTSNDFLYVPDKNGQGYGVVFVERAAWGTPFDHKRVYLSRYTVSWPQNNL